MKVRIQHDGSVAANYNTCVTDLETGEQLSHVMHVGLDIPANKDPITATITIACPVLDIIADAEIKHVCPCCGAPQEEEETTSSIFIGQD